MVVYALSRDRPSFLRLTLDNLGFSQLSKDFIVELHPQAEA
jgi:hypothetical protein